MAEGDDFRIKGAALRSSISEQSSSGSRDQAEESIQNPAGQAEESIQNPAGQAENAQSKDGIVGGPEHSNPAQGSQQEAMEEKRLLDRYKWYRCDVEGADQPSPYYYVHFDTHETTWEEPTESYWLWDPIWQRADLRAGLQTPSKPPPPVKPEDYRGYNPKIHGNYDKNADYAKWHEKIREEEALMADQQALIPALQKIDYTSAMVVNRFTGRAQVGDFGPERHSDAAKSGRQMNAFFDVDAAANANQGKSLKDERRNQKITKQQAKKFNQQRKEKKAKRRREFLSS